MGRYLIDNNVISNYFSEVFSEKGMSFIAEVIDQIPNISVVTEIEALSWVNSDASKEEIVREFVKDAKVLELTQAVVDKCVEIRRTKRIKVPDAIISATAIVHKLTLITSDSDFKNVKELDILDPYKL
jgi:predicted nucleic acid-binding protein